MADFVSWIETRRVGQLTGSSSWRDPRWPSPDDPLHIPVVNDTGRWGVMGVDMGACTEHSDGRLYIFFGDVATPTRRWGANLARHAERRAVHHPSRRAGPNGRGQQIVEGRGHNATVGVDRRITGWR
jgi:hypothetical protein